MRIVVAGAGAFGTGLAIALARKGDVMLWGRKPEHMDTLSAARENARHLPGCKLPSALEVTSDTGCIEGADIVLLCVPTQQISGFLKANVTALTGKSIIACCKGIDLETGLGPANVITAHIPTAISAILTGPSFAADIAQGLPTALTLACSDPDAAESLQTTLTRPTLRMYRTTDVAGAQLGGVITRGYAEMQRFAAFRGAEPETLMGLSGLGDLILTCTSPQSRNYSFGLSLGRCETYDPTKTVEGAHTARAVASLSEQHGLDMPISRAVDDLVQGRANVAEALRMLLSRPLKEE